MKNRADERSARFALLVISNLSALTAFALIAPAMHAGDTQVRVRVGMYRVGVVNVMNRFGCMIDMTGMRVRSRPAWPLAHAFVLGVKQGPDLLCGLLGGDCFLA